MLKVRKLATAAAVSLALASSGSFALTLGDIEMRSALNQPMDAEISLRTASANEIDGMIVKLASQDAFSRAGIERTAVLNDLSFFVDQTSAGVPVIRISSSRPVLEPFLNFLLEVDWPQGRMVREYTVLLDPPVFMSPDSTQRTTLTDNGVQRADDSLIVPVPIDRSSSSVSQGFDESSVVLLGSTEEVSNDVVGEIVELQPEVITFGADSSVSDSSIVSLDGSDPLADSGFGEVVVLGSDEEYSVVGGSSFDTSSVVTLTDSDAGFQPNFNTESFDGFNVEVLGELREVADSESGFIGGIGDTSGQVVSLDSFSGSASSGGEVVVGRNDTLWEIARDNKLSGMSTQQMMLALLEANQQAFINGNINLVKAGSILRIPDANEIGGLSQSAAVAEVSQQEQLWREYRDGARSNSASRVASRPTESTDTSASFETIEQETDAVVEIFDTENDSTAVNASSSTDSSTSSANTNAATDELAETSGELTAQQIIEQARAELRQARNELKLVGDSESTDIASSTTADEKDQPDTANLGALNQKLQLAREELASTRIASEELSARDDVLASTTENMDTLVSLRQNEVAKLEEQLMEARLQRDSVQESLALTANGEVEEVVGDATDAAGEQMQQVELFNENSDAAGDQTAVTGADAGTSKTRVVQPVELEPVKQSAWYENILGDKNKLIIGGVGLLALLGLLFTIFRRRGGREEEEFDAFDEDDVEFLDESQQHEGVEGFDESDYEESSSVSGGAVAAGGAAVAAVAAGSYAAANNEAEQIDEDEDLFASTTDNSSMELGGEADDIISSDDTISEADVYLAYGLHGQAEDLLNKAIDTNPSKPEYHQKLLQTYHAQSNSDSYDKAAEHYHSNFGGDGADNWSEISSLGRELNPANALYGSTGSAIESLGRGDVSAPKLDDNDFLVADSTGAVSSLSREFGSDLDDESHLMDQSIDPGMAFEESDLEATGDFTQIANEIKNSSSDTLDFPDSLNQTSELGSTGFDLETPDFGDSDIANSLTDQNLSEKSSSFGDMIGDKLGGAKAAVGGAAVGIAGAGAGLLGMGSDAKASNDSVDDIDLDASLGLDSSVTGLSGDLGDGIIEFDETSSNLTSGIGNSASSVADGLTSSADDLTMDLDQLTGDLELGSSDLLSDGANLGGGFDSGLSTDLGSDLGDGLEMPDLTAGGDLTSDASAAFGNADEMDTMMDLAKAYIDMGDKDSASSALGEIVKSGSPQQKSEAETLLRKIS